ncbi:MULTISPECIES: pyrimidine utilization protein D [Enterobacter]|uniref:pyrimidine utilization protein D n=1 Tax=Enterobacter TaxID=547 RepID=UPI000FEB7FB8|nr:MULTISPECIES: pyrimidine utilization protein D [Enterobacter]MCR1302761.1 pyrimidine utilization protein D [Enterobacter sp. FL1277]MCR1307633.1 pyrimidine utilization protein D [Enterobacter sp. BT1271]MCR1313063.1 pyrimidine utilization protein D [Enterobacter sp. BT855]MCR1323783.1 pyrimidine utilization protein D [Enterobacter sp. BT1268]MCR1328429.1 pyrimidine utilization protein D [Enterobacter sp. BT1131]
MKLSVSQPPYEGAPVVVLIAGLGGSGSYWLPQLATLEKEYRVVCYDQRGTGNNPATLPEGYSLAEMADELAQALNDAGITRYCVVGHALGALVGLQLALDKPESLTALVCVNGWLTLNAHTRRCFQIRERLLHAGGAQAWVEAQPLFLYPADWMAARAPRLEAEDALALTHFQGKANLLRRLDALKKADFSRHAARIRCPVHIICSVDDMLVPSVCSTELQVAIPHSHKAVMRQGGHACNVTEPDIFNTLLLNGLASLLHSPEPAL